MEALHTLLYGLFWIVFVPGSAITFVIFLVTIIQDATRAPAHHALPQT